MLRQTPCCQAIAEHVAELAGSQVGAQVGYQVRFEHRVTDETKLRFMTEGMFLQLLESDPILKDYQYIVLDEFHEDAWMWTFPWPSFADYKRHPSRLETGYLSATVDLSSLEQYLPQCKASRFRDECFKGIGIQPYSEEKNRRQGFSSCRSHGS